MKKEISIPAMGESISEGIIGQFVQPEGAFVKDNDEIIEIETDKVNQPLYAPASGQLHWSVQVGEKCPIGQVIGYVDTTVQPAAAVKQPHVIIPDGLQKSPEKPPEAPLQTFDKPTEPIQTKSSKEERREAMSTIRLTIARRLVSSLHEAAMLTTFNEVDMSAIMGLRKEHQEAFQKKFEVKLGFMSFFVTAVVDALKAYPLFNAYLEGTDIVYRNGYHIGIAVGAEKGLVVPVIRHADHLQLHEIESQIAQYAQKARQGKLAISDLEGGGFTITNGGIYGSLLSTPILNPTQVGILGMHKIMDRPIALSGEVVIRPMMYLALSYDHRIVDGKEAVSFLVHIKSILEQPATLLF